MLLVIAISNVINKLCIATGKSKVFNEMKHLKQLLEPKFPEFIFTTSFQKLQLRFLIQKREKYVLFKYTRSKAMKGFLTLKERCLYKLRINN